MARKRRRRKRSKNPKTPYLNKKVIAMERVGPHMHRLTLSCGHTVNAADPVDRVLAQPKYRKCFKCKKKIAPEVAVPKRRKADAEKPRPRPKHPPR